MTYNLLTVEPLSNEAVAQALAHCLGLPVHDVDVADEHTDQDLRNWDALVLCEKTAVQGDLTVSLEVYAQDSVRLQPDEADLATEFARAAHAVVLYPAEEALPSAYWLTTDDGTVTRARLLTSHDENPTYTIDTVEAPVARLPHAQVARLPEIVREQRTVTPVSDRFTALLHTLDRDQADRPGTPHWKARTSLAAWEQLIRTMADRWAPAGWYPADLYLERLDARDELEVMQRQLTPQAVELLQLAAEPLDKQFFELTVQDDTWLSELPQPSKPDHTKSESRGWWWHRRPDPLPW
ncbi:MULTISPECIES: hypothetical protein [unclassified Streptomyces]|uniref:hypothetical protein n=1 Tax=unclassified Streptomyces TaxID=2593676 RepID=UPI0036EDEAC2